MRSGSTLLCDLLANTKLAGQPQEFFLEKWEAKSEFDFTNYPDYVYKTLESFSSDNGVSGVKLMWVNFNDILRRLRESQENPSDSDLELLKKVFPNLKYIFISRKNKVRQAISLARSAKTKLWNKYQDKENSKKVSFNRYSNTSKTHKNYYPYISPGSIKVYLSQIEKDESAWLKFFKDNNIEAKTIIYEELVQNKAKNIHSILDFLSILSFEDIKMDSHLQKQADIYTELLIIQYKIVALFEAIFPDWIVRSLYNFKEILKNVTKTANSKG